MNFETFEDAIQEQIALAAGLPGARVIWKAQGADALALGVTAGFEKECVTISIDSLEALATATPEINITDTAGAPTQELGLTLTAQTEIKLSIEYFSMSKTGTGSAFARLSALRNKLLREAASEALFTADLVLVDVSRIQNVPRILETNFESRAVCECRLRVADTDTERVTYIQTVIVTKTIKDEAGNIQPN